MLCFPILAMGGEVVIMHAGPTCGAFLELVASHRVTHTFLPPTLIYMLLGLDRTWTDADLSLAAVLLVRRRTDVERSRLDEALVRIGPVMAQLFGQSEAPMMISMMSPAEHFGGRTARIARERLALGRPHPSPLVTVAIMDDGRQAPAPDRRSAARSSSAARS